MCGCQVHQVFELWFKLIIQELIEASQLLEQSYVPEVSRGFGLGTYPTSGTHGIAPQEEIPKVVHKLKRCSEIFRLLAQQWKVTTLPLTSRSAHSQRTPPPCVSGNHLQVVETLQPQDFLAFRDGLGRASGFESFQIRQLEMVHSQLIRSKLVCSSEHGACWLQMVGLCQPDRVDNFTDPLIHFKRLADEGGPADGVVFEM